MRRKRTRSLSLETLERRELFAAGFLGSNFFASRQNPVLPADVNTDSVVTPLDALLVINRLSRESRGEHALESMSPPTHFYDTSGDGQITSVDIVHVLNSLEKEPEKAVPMINTLASEGTDSPSLPNVDNSMAALSLTSMDEVFHEERQYAASLGAEAELSPSYEAVISARDAAPDGLMTEAEVQTLLDRASRASKSTDAIIVVVDRGGRILGVRVEAGVNAAIQSDPAKLAFAIDGAVAKARTAAFFSNSSTPLTSRTLRFISQSTMTQREIESSPDNIDPRFRGPGFVSTVGVGGNFPPEVRFAPQVDVLGIERQIRDSKFNAGADGVLGTPDDFELNSRFNINLDAVPELAKPYLTSWPESYGIASETSELSRSRGFGVLPGGVPLFKPLASGGVNLVGAIGVFFPGPDGFATHEQSFVPGIGQSESQRTNAPKVLEAEYMALVASAGGGIAGSKAFQRNIKDINAKLPALPNFIAINGRIDLVGITLEIFGPTPTRKQRKPGIDQLLTLARKNIGTAATSGIDVPVARDGVDGVLYLAGEAVPEGWLVAPHDSPVPGGLTAAEVETMILNGIAKAEMTRSAIRLNSKFLPGPRTEMVFTVSDTSGNVLGLYRMPDGAIEAFDVAVAKARNTAYYSDPTDLQDIDRVDFNEDGSFDTGDSLPLGTAVTGRTFRLLSAPRYPTGAELPKKRIALVPETPICEQSAKLCRMIGPFNGLRMPGINPYTAENVGAPLPIDVYASPTSRSANLFDAFVPSRNFRDPGDADVVIFGTDVLQPLANQNGVVFFPGGTPIYRREGDEVVFLGGLGVTGDGKDQDDVVTSGGQVGFTPPPEIRADQFFVGGVRLTFQKFNRNPLGK